MHKTAPLFPSGDETWSPESSTATTPSSEGDEEKGASTTVRIIETDDAAPGSVPKHGKLRLLLLWRYELLSMVASVGALLATVAVLFAFDGKPMSHWKAIAQPNTVVSALSTLAKSSMLMVISQGLGQLKWEHFERRSRRLIDFEIFDGASRGPWGALELLCRIRWRALAGSTGAVIIVLAVTMDPFAQQVIQFDSRLVTARNMTSVIGAARTYDMNSRWETSTNTATRSSYNKVRDTKIIGAVYQGVFGPDTQVPFDCPSGDCTWPPFESMGICNKCVDITAATNASISCEDGGHASWDSANPLMSKTCHYQTPSGYRVDGQAANWNFMDSYEQRHTLWNSTTYWQGWPRSAGESEPDDGIATIAALKFVEYDDTIIARPEIWLESAHECTISWCAMAFNSTRSENGHLRDDSTSTPLVFLDKMPCYSNMSDQDPSSPNMAFSSTGDTMTSIIVPGYKADELPDFNCTHENGTMTKRFVSDPKAFWLNSQDNKNIVNAIGAMLTTTSETVSRPGDDPARALFRAESFPDIMDRVARSMTNSIRTGPNQTEIHGEVKIAEQHIHVRWPWMILPAALVLLSVVFLIVTMVMAGKRSAGWKSSALPSFYHGLSGEEIMNSRQHDIDVMTRDASSIFVRLEMDGDGRTRLTRTHG